MAKDKESDNLERKYKLLSSAKEKYRDMLFSKSNVHGIDIGYRVRGGKTLDEMVVKVYVTRKVPKNLLDKEDLVPAKLTIGQETVPVDVEESTIPVAQVFKLRTRPLIGGSSIGASTRTGTLGVCVQPGHHDFMFILSCEHVLLGAGTSGLGTLIRQPSESDVSAGEPTPDFVAAASHRVPIDFGTTAHNHVDAALAAVIGLTGHNINHADRAIYYIGYPDFRTLNLGLSVGLGFGQTGPTVHKMGRTTHYTVGYVTSVSFDCLIDYSELFGNAPETNLAMFVDQIRIVGLDGPFSDRGDSGSLVLDANSNRPVGLLFAGATDGSFSIANHINRVMTALDIPRI